MKAREISIVIKVGARTKALRESAKSVGYANLDAGLYGLSEYYGPKKGLSDRAKVWIYHRQTQRELADTFFHEMMHVFLHMFSSEKQQREREEAVCSWNGYLAKALLTDYAPKKFAWRLRPARRDRRRRR